MQKIVECVPNFSEGKNLPFFEHGALTTTMPAQIALKFNLNIVEKKITAFIGPSGCGKSTLLRVFNRMYDLYPEQKAEGEVKLYGDNILHPKRDLNLLRAKVGMIFQKPTPFPMSIYDNIAFGVRLYENLKKQDMDLRVEWALKKAALWNEVKDKMKQSGLSLSGGQQQRLCIARTLAVEPSIILMDEPTSGMDSVAENLFIKNMHTFLKQRTLLFVTHKSSMMSMIDKIILMDAGKVVAFGPRDEVLKKLMVTNDA